MNHKKMKKLVRSIRRRASTPTVALRALRIIQAEYGYTWAGTHKGRLGAVKLLDALVEEVIQDENRRTAKALGGGACSTE